MWPILKQTTWLFCAQIFTRIISFFYTIYLARTLGISDFGLFTVAMVYFSLGSSISDFGFNRFFIREVARDSKKMEELLFNVSFLRLMATTGMFLFFAAILYLFDPDRVRTNLILIGVMAVIPQSVGQTLDAVFVALRRLQVSAVSLLIVSLTTATVGFVLVTKGYGPFGAITALLIGQVAYLLVLGLFLEKWHAKIISSIKLSVLKKITLGALPYGILGVMGLLYFRLDTILLSYMRGNYETGIYGAAYRFLEAIVFIPIAYSSALFPVLSKLHDGHIDQVKKLYISSVKLMGILGLLVVLGYILILPWLIRYFLPGYIEALNIVIILSLAIPFMFLHVPAVQVLFSTDKYLKWVIGLSFITLGFNLVANLLFIPVYGLYAAAWITTLSEALSFLVFFIFVKIKILDKT
ncbi:flippase [Candidatus Daviesbacteria bacterium]|nr:flippase [Candidatus Daviesbacteria bacterium]